MWPVSAGALVPDFSGVPALTALENVRVALQRQHGHSFDFWRSKTVLDRSTAAPISCWTMWA